MLYSKAKISYDGYTLIFKTMKTDGLDIRIAENVLRPFYFMRSKKLQRKIRETIHDKVNNNQKVNR